MVKGGRKPLDLIELSTWQIIIIIMLFSGKNYVKFTCKFDDLSYSMLNQPLWTWAKYS